jgi:hypothetical protein
MLPVCRSVEMESGGFDKAFHPGLDFSPPSKETGQ